MVEHGCVQWETLRKNWEPMIRMGVCVSYKELGAIRVGPRVGHRRICFKKNVKKRACASLTKNWEPFVLGPELAIERIPAPVCLSSRVISSSNLRPHTDSPPRPDPVGSPPWEGRGGRDGLG